MSAGNRKGLKIKKLKAVVFDLDGTLIDSKNDILKAFHSAFASLRKPAPSDGELMRTVGNKLEECFIPFLGDDEELCSKAARAFRQFYEKHYLDETKPFGGISGILNDFGGKFDFGLATMKKGYYARKILNAFSWDKLFKSIAAAEEGLKQKPDPEMLLKVTSDLKSRAGETLYVGDTSLDLEMAESAGVPFLFAGWGYGKPDCKTGTVEIMKNPGEFKDYLQEMQKS